MFSSHFEAVNHYKATHCWRTYQCHLCGTYFNNQNTMVSVVAHELCCEWTLLRLHNVQCTFVREFHSSFFLDQVLIHSSTDPSYHFHLPRLPSMTPSLLLSLWLTLVLSRPLPFQSRPLLSSQLCFHHNLWPLTPLLQARHLVEIHGEEPSIACDKCSQKFTTKTHLDRHRQTVHEEKKKVRND